MKPIPSSSGNQRSKPAVSQLPSVSGGVVQPSATSYSVANRKLSTAAVTPWYPVLLILSLGVASLFCWLYMTKPVVVTAGTAATLAPIKNREHGGDGAEDAAKANFSQPAAILPTATHLPGDESSQQPNADQQAAYPLPAPSIGEFEETNLRMQHVLTAAAENGEMSRLIVDVPVLYRSRNLRWTSAEIAEARRLLIQLGDYQEKSQALRSEGVALLEDWNQLVERSLPLEGLRADSPSLPTNQEDAATGPRAANLDTLNSIQASPEP